MPSVIRRPNADGTYTQCQIYPDTPTTHYDKVNEETPDEDATYLTTPSEDLGTYIDTFLKSSLGLPAGAEITKARVHVRVRRDAPTGNPSEVKVDRELYISSNLYSLPAVTSSDVYENQYSDWDTNPATGVAWTEADINAMEVGIGLINGRKSVGGIWYWSFPRCTQLWLEVFYTVPPPPTGGILVQVM